MMGVQSDGGAPKQSNHSQTHTSVPTAQPKREASSRHNDAPVPTQQVTFKTKFKTISQDKTALQSSFTSQRFSLRLEKFPAMKKGMATSQIYHSSVLGKLVGLKSNLAIMATLRTLQMLTLPATLCSVIQAVC